MKTGNLIYIAFALPFVCGIFPILCGCVFVASVLFGFGFSYRLCLMVYAALLIVGIIAVIIWAKKKRKVDNG